MIGVPLINLTGRNALIIGGTSGIGEGIAYNLASKKANVIIAGRNAEAGNRIVAKLQEINESGQYQFKSVDFTSIKDTRRFTSEIKTSLDRLHYLILTAGMFRLGGRQETPEGLDDKMALHYYARFCAIRELLGLLEAAAEGSEDTPKVVTVLGATKGSLVHDGDFSLKTHYGVSEAAQACTLYNDLMVEEFSLRHPAVSFFHSSPGVVNTNLARNFPAFVRYPAEFLAKHFASSPESCAESMMRGVFSPAHQRGWFLLDEQGENYNKVVKDHTPEIRKKVWDHTVEVLDGIQ
eukprot:TRINITY_DN2220_c0_g1_i1.p1 TRINITY_DN2220_c0_g1~~TRINITY_DN2220_c0_g1_i1.p1  ORF type:complete len:293 (+),score=45.17 TRINITY_DN2220_c0_g1_i1:40-918(+)